VTCLHWTHFPSVTNPAAQWTWNFTIQSLPEVTGPWAVVALSNNTSDCGWRHCLHWVKLSGTCKHCTMETSGEHIYCYFDHSVAFRPQANYTDWATATGRLILVITFANKGVSHGECGRIPTAVILSFLGRSRSFFLQVALHLCSRGWVNQVSDPLVLRIFGSAGNRILDFWDWIQGPWPLDHRGGPISITLSQIHILNLILLQRRQFRIQLEISPFPTESFLVLISPTLPHSLFLSYVCLMPFPHKGHTQIVDHKPYPYNMQSLT
jgi:hypothetical protein